MVLISIKNCPVKHIFQLLTKNPELIPPNCFVDHDNIWVGTTVTQKSELENIDYVVAVNAKVTFASFEPFLFKYEDIEDVALQGLEWIIIGKLTGSKRVKLDVEAVMDLVVIAKRLNIPIFMKNNLSPPFEKSLLIQEFPRVG